MMLRPWQRKKKRVYPHFLFIIWTHFFLFFKSCTHFLYPTHFMFAIIFWSSFCFFFSFSFLIYIFQLKIQHNWESVFWWGKLVLVKPTYLIFFFFNENIIVFIFKKMKTSKSFIQFLYSNSFFFNWKWKLDANMKLNNFFSSESH